MNIAYTDTFSGISGDMFLGALLDAGLPRNILLKELAKLPLTGYSFQSEQTKEKSIHATRISIQVENDQPHRSWKSIQFLLNESDLLPLVKEKAMLIFGELAKAEAKVHGCDPADVHFHEVGAIDSIIDIVGAAIGLHYFQIDRLISSPLPLSRGWVACDHGQLPLPAPAVCELTEGMPVYGVELEQELVTPTGAAILKALAHSFGPFPTMTVERSGYGAGSRQLQNNQPNLLRLVIGASFSAEEVQEVEIIECHLDDFSPELFPYLSEQLFARGALDVALTPIQMKKGRPAFLLCVIADPAESWELKKCILSESTAIGLRFHREHRWTLSRKSGWLQTRWGKVAVKKVTTPAGESLYPEYEDCRRLALEHGIPLKRVYNEVSRAEGDDFLDG
ncbi:MAG: nickel pincer cofactor biosynthesis protein LarC [Desulfobulbaceae bacterium]|nr:nickel pincer cofactor biosynthesis protein LarC [Desulfobulbaceae bacterium]